MIKPTIGRIVWYWPSKAMAEEAGAQAYAASVTYVHDSHLVNLAVLDHNGDSRSRTSVKLFQADPGEERPDEPHCEWMPYQKGQAAAGTNEALEKRITALEAIVSAAAAANVKSAVATQTATPPVPPPTK